MISKLFSQLAKALAVLLAICIAAPSLAVLPLPSDAFASPDDKGVPMTDPSRFDGESEDSSSGGATIFDVSPADKIDESYFDEGTGSKNQNADVKDVTILPSSYFLTNDGLVTPVKLQSPWGDCWAFAIASAVESSILKKSAELAEEAAATSVDASASSAESSADTSSNTLPNGTVLDTNGNVTFIDITNTQTTDHGTPVLLDLNESIDISERALAWLAHEVQTVENAGTQAGEGFFLVDSGDFLNQLSEGSFEMIESQLVSRQSLVSEEAVPYQYNDYDASPEWFSTGSYDGAYNDARIRDWSVDATYRTNTEIGWVVDGIYKLESPAMTRQNSDGSNTYIAYDPSATTNIKETLMNVGAVAVAIEADSSIPADVSNGNFTNAEPSGDFTYSTWSQYNASSTLDYNHAVSIVGWDDNYSASNFAGTSSGAPPGDGAWLCKNNWGSDAFYEQIGASGEATHWGISADSATGLAANGGDGTEASGFFWLSYYDHTIHSPVAFSVTPVEEDFENIYQYDYLGSAEYSKPATYEEEIWVANMFTASKVELLEAISAQTFSPHDEVHARIYVVPEYVDITDMTIDEIFAIANEVAKVRETFSTAGFHTIKLESPVLLNKGDRFIVSEMVQQNGTYNDGTPYKGTYLNLEMSFLEPAPGDNAITMSKVVANPMESFVSLPAGTSIWADTTEYGEWYSDSEGATAESAGVAFGNALAKAFTADTSISKIGQIYGTVRLR